MVKMEINPAKRKGGIAKGIRLMIEKIKNLAMKIFLILFGLYEGLDGGRQPQAHGFSEYEGPPICVACHREEATEMFGAVHYQWTGATPNVVNIDGTAGKGTGA